MKPQEIEKQLQEQWPDAPAYLDDCFYPAYTMVQQLTCNALDDGVSDDALTLLQHAIKFCFHVSNPVTSKHIEDYSVSYQVSALDVNSFAAAYKPLIDSISKCTVNADNGLAMPKKLPRWPWFIDQSYLR